MRTMTKKLVVAPGSNVLAIDPVIVTFPKPTMDTGNWEDDKLLVNQAPAMGIVVPLTRCRRCRGRSR